MLSVLSSNDGRRDLPALIGQRDRLVDRRIGLDRDHVGPRHHDLAHDGVAELEDRVDQLAFARLDRRLVGGDVRHLADLLLGDERALLEALARAASMFTSPSSPRTITRIGAKSVTKRRNPDVRSAACSVCCTAHVFGAASANTKNTITFRTRLSTTIHQPELPSRLPSKYDVMSCAASASSVTALTVRSGRSSMRTRRVGALLALFFERHRLHATHPQERGLGRGEDDREEEEDDDRDDGQRHRAHAVTNLSRINRNVPVSGGRATGRLPLPFELTEPFEELLFSSAHHRRLLGLGMVVVQQVQDPVDDQQREFVVGRQPPLARLAVRHRRGTPPRHRAASADPRDRSARRGRGRPGRAGAHRAARRRPSGTRGRRSGRPHPESVRSAPRSSARRRRAATSRPSGPNRSGTRSASSTSCASRTQRGTSTTTSRCSSAPNTDIADDPALDRDCSPGSAAPGSWVTLVS